MLSAHNAYRKNHSAPALAQDDTIVSVASKYATYLAQNNLFQHSSNGYGENLARMWSSTPTTPDCASNTSKEIHFFK